MRPSDAQQAITWMVKAADSVRKGNFPVDLEKELGTRAILLLSEIYRHDRQAFEDITVKAGGRTGA